MTASSKGLMQPKFKHAAILNALVDMQASPAYAVRKSVLQEAELTIAGLDVEVDKLLTSNTELLDGCNALLGLLQLWAARDDELGKHAGFALRNNHRVQEALAAVAKVGPSSMEEPRFTLTWAGQIESEGPFSLTQALAANPDDEPLCAWLRAAAVGDEYQAGGGAEAAGTVRRIA